MTTDAFTAAARAEAEQYTPTDEEVRTDYVTAYADRDSSQLLAGMAFDRWLAKRDQIIRRQERYIEELESGRITPRDHLAAQEPTDVERYVRDLHRRFGIFEHEDACPDPTDEHREEHHHEDSDDGGEYYCDQMPIGAVCDHCRDQDGERVDWPCPTIQALTAAKEARR